jgi:uncharacterized protein (DUF58 family)
VKVDFARLNHILIPEGYEGRDRFRKSYFGRVVVPVVSFLWGSYTDEGRTLAFVTVLVGAFSIEAQRSTAYVLFSILTGLLAASLIASRRVKADNLSLVVNAPRRITIGDDVTFTLHCAFLPTARRDATHARHPIRVRGPFLPWDGSWVDEAPAELVVPDEGDAQTVMRARFISRGLHHLDPFTAAAVVPGGLACGPRIRSESVKFHVVPRIANVVRLPHVLATRHHPGGVALASKSGEAMDLLGVRPYRPGDPVRDLHARSWARTGVPSVREYQQEYFTRVGVVLDTDCADSARLEAAIELAAGVVAHLARGEVLVDVIVVGDTVHELTVGRSLGYLNQALDMLATVKRGPKVSAAELVRRLEPYLDRLASVVSIALDGGEASKALKERIEDRGIVCTTIVVDDTVLASITAKEPLAW